MKVAIIGCGDVGGAYARALQGKAELALCDIVNDGRQGRLADEIGLPINLAPAEWLTDCDVIIAAVPGSESPVAAKDALPFVGTDALYVDVSTGAPQDIYSWSQKYADAERRFVDVAILSSITIFGGATPVLIAGDDAEKAKPTFEAMGAPVQIMEDGKPGDAVALKLLRSVILKGLECLSVECLTAAEHLGLRDKLFGIMGDLDARSISDVMSALVKSHIVHAERRKHEMQESSDQLKALGFDALVTDALQLRYDATLQGRTDNPPGDATHEALDTALAWLTPTCRKQDG